MRKVVAVAVWLALGGGCGSSDAGSSPDARGGGETCSPSADTCPGETLCVGGSCVAAFGRIYTIGNVAVQLPAHKTNGDAWDALGGAPDPLLTVTLNGTIVLMPPSVADSFTATFPQTADADIPAGSTLVVAVDDEDVTANDPGFACQANPLTAAELRARVLSCMSGDALLTFHINPR